MNLTEKRRLLHTIRRAGVSIETFCEQNRLPIETAVELKAESLTGYPYNLQKQVDTSSDIPAEESPLNWVMVTLSPDYRGFGGVYVFDYFHPRRRYEIRRKINLLLVETDEIKEQVAQGNIKVLSRFTPEQKQALEVRKEAETERKKTEAIQKGRSVRERERKAIKDAQDAADREVGK